MLYSQDYTIQDRITRTPVLQGHFAGNNIFYICKSSINRISIRRGLARAIDALDSRLRCKQLGASQPASDKNIYQLFSMRAARVKSD